MKLSGLWPALFTPLDDHGNVDHDALAATVDDLIGRGVDGVVPLGSTGEFTEFTAVERREILTTVVTATSGRVPVLAGVSGLSTRETCSHTVDAADAGVDAVLALPPVYWKVPQERMFDHFRAVADASDRAVVVYDFPGLTAQPLPAALLRRLAAEEPRVIGAKLTVRDIQSVTAALAATRPERDDFAIVTGFEDLIPAVMWAGGDGAISGLANLVPDLMVELVAAIRTDKTTVAELYRQVMTIFDVYTLSTPAIPGLKAAAAVIGRLGSPVTRLDAGSPSSLTKAAHEWAQQHSLLAG